MSDVNADIKTYWALRERVALEALEKRLDAIEGALSDEARMEDATARVLVTALRNAGSKEPRAMGAALAPYVVGAIRSEIRNSRDDMVEALSPIVGRLVRAAVANAMRDLSAKVEAAMPIDRWIANIQSRIFGVSALGAQLHAQGAFSIIEALLIDRQSGALIARRGGDEAMDGDMLAGMISAIVGFSEEVFANSAPDAVRSVDLTDSTVYLRAGGRTLLALRGRGAAPADVESQLDSLFDRALAQLGKAAPEPQAQASLLENLSREAEDAFKPQRKRPVIAIGFFAAVGLSVLIAWGYGLYTSARQDARLADAERAAFMDAALIGWPIMATYNRDKKVLVIRGLVPHDAARSALEARVKGAVSDFPLAFELGTATNGGRE